jgi:hypothetical protein
MEELTQFLSKFPAELPVGRDMSILPKCPHCGRRFPTWSRAKIHVKRCKMGKHPQRSIAERLADK